MQCLPKDQSTYQATPVSSLAKMQCTSQRKMVALDYSLLSCLHAIFIAGKNYLDRIHFLEEIFPAIYYKI